MALAIRREIRRRGCLNFSGAEASNPSRISERLFGLRRRRKLSACQTDVNHSPCRPNFNDCAARALSGAPKKKKNAAYAFRSWNKPYNFPREGSVKKRSLSPQVRNVESDFFRHERQDFITSEFTWNLKLKMRKLLRTLRKLYYNTTFKLTSSYTFLKIMQDYRKTAK